MSAKTQDFKREKDYDLICKKLEHLSRQPFASSVQYFLEKGTVNGSFVEALYDLMDTVRQEASVDIAGK